MYMYIFLTLSIGFTDSEQRALSWGGPSCVTILKRRADRIHNLSHYSPEPIGQLVRFFGEIYVILRNFDSSGIFL
jgi:hypothetical protein